MVLMAPRCELNQPLNEHYWVFSQLFGFSLNALLFLFPFGCAELRPAEVYFQMHLLARQSAAAVSQQNQLVETMQSPELWLLRAIHLNPSCPRYWKALLQQMDV